jgi:hypothetical protein
MGDLSAAWPVNGCGLSSASRRCGCRILSTFIGLIWRAPVFVSRHRPARDLWDDIRTLSPVPGGGPRRSEPRPLSGIRARGGRWARHRLPTVHDLAIHTWSTRPVTATRCAITHAELTMVTDHERWSAVTDARFYRAVAQGLLTLQQTPLGYVDPPVTSGAQS